MAFVSTFDGIRYGIDLLGYIATIVIIVYVVALASLALIQDGNGLLAAIIILFGAFVGVAAMAGLSYKIIADAVQTGIQRAD
jgi:hypothetical protein